MFRFLALFLVCSIVSQVYGTDYARCDFAKKGRSHGHICLKDENGQIEGHVDLHHHGHLKQFPAHIHQRAPKRGRCSTIGGHYNVDATDGDEGNLGTFTAGIEGAVHVDSFMVNSALSLNGENAIMGRSIAVHLRGKKICCKIVASNEADYNDMLSDDHDDDHDHEDDHDDDHHN